MFGARACGVPIAHRRAADNHARVVLLVSELALHADGTLCLVTELTLARLPAATEFDDPSDA